ncbi:MAG TPA: phospholipase D-like domain-containing protein, partial [Thermodesulfobacteriota bacterium]|nr:phospholipase D-like domain-containing protein [Thermodesulfobacteriota bacterium]
ERDHRKILIVDGKVAFMGGINIAKVYSEGSGKLFGGNTNLPWRDTHVRIEGPAVAEIQKLFLEAWAEQHGPKLESGQLFPRLDGKGDDLVQVVGNRPGEDTPKIYFMYFANIAWAERTVYLTNPYFVPDDRILDALKGAARRGVDVRILLPGSSDIGVIFYAGRSFYTELLKAGVRLYERKGVLLHAKTAVIDGVWSTVGSTNLEMWSFTRNFEANTIILNPGFAFEMEQLFFYDLADSKEVRLEEWERRPARERVKEWFIRRFRHWL